MTAPTTAATARAASAPIISGGSWLRIQAVARRHWYVLLRSPHRTFDVIFWPVVDVVLFGSIGTLVSNGDASAGRIAAGYLLSGVVLWHVVYQTQISLSTGFLEETWSRNVLNLIVTPLREWEYAAGVALMGLVKTVIGVGAVALCAAGAFGFGITRLGWVLVPVVALLMLSGWVVALFVIGLVLRFGSGAEALAWGILFAIMPLSGTMYPVSNLPRPLRPISQLLPTTHAFAAGRSVLDGGGIPWHELAIAGATTLAAGLVAMIWVTKMLAKFRAKGWVTRYS